MNTRPLKSQRGDQGLRGGDFVGFLVDHLVSEDDLMIDGEDVADMRRLAVRESVEALTQRFSIEGDEPRGRVGASTIEPLRMAPERLLQFSRIEPLQNAAHRCVGRRPSQRRFGEGRIEKREPSRIRERICRYERAPLSIAKIENRITPIWL